MTIPSVQVKASEIQSEFGGTNPISLSEYYLNFSNVPASGEIRYSDFRNLSLGSTSLTHTLVSPDGAQLNNDLFGIKMDYDPDSDRYAIGATGRDNRSAYVFSGTSKSHLYTLNGDNLLSSPGLIKAGEGRITFTEPNYSAPGQGSSGRALVYRSSDGVLLFTVWPNNPVSGDFIGSAAAHGGSRIAIGAGGQGSPDGRVYVYNTSGTLQYTLQNPVSHSNARYAYTEASVAISSNLLLVSDYATDTNGSQSGTVYGYNLSTGSLSFTIHGASADDYFGENVVGDENMSIWATSSDNANSFDGALWIYNNSGTLIAELSGPSSTNENFGRNLDIAKNKIVTNAPTASTPKVYIFSTSGSLKTTIQSGSDFADRVHINEEELLVARLDGNPCSVSLYSIPDNSNVT